MIMQHSADCLKRFVGKSGLNHSAQLMVCRLVLAFILHRGRMSCSAAAGIIASQPAHRSEVTTFLPRPRWRKDDWNSLLRQDLLERETGRGTFLFIVDATMFSQAGKKVQNTYSTGNVKRRPRKGRRYNQKKVRLKKVHSFTFGLLITPSGHRIPFQIPHYTKAYCEKKGVKHLTTAEAAAKLVRELPLPDEAQVLVLGDTAYDAKCLRQACDERGWKWIVPANAERVYDGPAGSRPKLRSRLKDWEELSLTTIRLHAPKGKYAVHRRLSRWRVGPKVKPREYFAHQEERMVRNVGCVQIVFSTMKKDLKRATADDVKILLTNATDMGVAEVIEAYATRWQIELFFKELKSTFGVGQYQFEKFEAVEAWMNCAITAVLFLEHLRAKRLSDKRLKAERRRWWKAQRLYGLGEAFRQECAVNELKYLRERLKTPGGTKKLERMLNKALQPEYRLGG